MKNVRCPKCKKEARLHRWRTAAVLADGEKLLQCPCCTFLELKSVVEDASWEDETTEEIVPPEECIAFGPRSHYCKCRRCKYGGMRS